MRKKILIINDDEDIMELLKIVFRDSGHDILLRRSITRPEQILVLHPDLILMDVFIRGSSKSGADFCKELKTNPYTADVPIILCSGQHDLEVVAHKSHANSFIAKPFNTAKLWESVNTYLS